MPKEQHPTDDPATPQVLKDCFAGTIETMNDTFASV